MSNVCPRLLCLVCLCQCELVDGPCFGEIFYQGAVYLKILALAIELMFRPGSCGDPIGS